MKTTMQSGVLKGMFLLHNYSESKAEYQDSMIESIIESIVEPIIFKC